MKFVQILCIILVLLSVVLSKRSRRRQRERPSRRERSCLPVDAKGRQYKGEHDGACNPKKCKGISCVPFAGKCCEYK